MNTRPPESASGPWPPESASGPWPKSRVPGQIRRIKQMELKLVPREPPPPKAFAPLTAPDALLLWDTWFLRHGWRAHPFQREAWGAHARGESGVISVPTGSGKTYAALGGPLLQLLQRGVREDEPGPLTLLYIVPLKALARDIAQAIDKPIQEMGLPFRVEIRTGDTDAATRAALTKDLPQILVTTPESLALLTSEKGWEKRFSPLRTVVVDEWHDLLGTKRGSLLELTLARLRTFVPGLQTWALSATLGNLREAAAVAVGRETFTEIRDEITRETDIQAILPRESLPWFGTAALRLKEELLEHLSPEESTILFTNTRAQAELWYETLRRSRPGWETILALHHGSLDKEERARVENGVKSGELRIVVATSSLDLGVDFPHVRKVVQVGSVKSVVRALQRSGRAEHSPGKKSRLLMLPTNLFDLVETSALRAALKRNTLEGRVPLPAPMDVLLQFLLNSAFGEGFSRAEAELWIQAAPSFRAITKDELDWALAFLGGEGVLNAYPDFHKLKFEAGRYKFSSPRLARLHRLNIGTIVGASGVSVQFLSGKKLGQVDESFVSRLRKGDVFQFGGRALEIVQLRDMVAYVRLAKAGRMLPAVWNGQVLPVSSVIAGLVRKEWTKPSFGSRRERSAVEPLLAQQAERSHVPSETEVLVEQWHSKAGHHTFIYLFEGRLVHEGLGHVLAFRFGRMRPNTISVSANDQGLELLSTEPLGSEAEIRAQLMDAENLMADIESSLNFPELVKRAFREVARVAGLVQQAVPGTRKSTRQVQMSTGLLYEVFASYDAGNLLLREARAQARREQLDYPRLEQTLARIRESVLVFRTIQELTPFSLPLHVERVRSQISTEELVHRVERLQRKLFGRGELRAN